MSERPTQPQVLRRIVFGFTVDCLPGNLILGCHQLKRMIERAGFDVKVTMTLIDEMPTDVDLLFVPPELADVSQRFTSQCRVEVLRDLANHPIYNTLIRQLETGVDWVAPPLVGSKSTEDNGQIVCYRGYERID